ncbi:MAG: Thymidylate kinase [Fimbriimonadaceae bacterium]|nr:Thymidylate kinase [Fimbriimonadaceae bacterium]
MPGFFVTFEGPEGAGKTTAMANVAELLRNQGQDVLMTREPGSGEIGQAIRRILLEAGHVPPLCELFLFLADRSQHVELEIKPALARGQTVLCDRYADSTLVYQGYGRGLDLAVLRDLNHLATGGLLPNLTVLLDIDIAEGLARLALKDRLDREPIEFHEKVRQGFLAEASADPKRWLVTDASQQPERVAQEIAEEILRRYSR